MDRQVSLTIHNLEIMVRNYATIKERIKESQLNGVLRATAVTPFYFGPGACLKS
jgi:queuine/archaeosine tRNA-ribosyltransferase